MRAMRAVQAVLPDQVTLPEAWRATSHHADLGGSAGQVHYVEFGATGDNPGAGGGPPDDGKARAPFALVHGLGGSYVNWAALAPRLAACRRVLALDLPGFGRSEPMGRSARVRSNAAALSAFVDQVVGEAPVLVGNSMGGMLSIMHAARHRVAGLALIDPVLPRVAGAPLDREVALAFLAYAVPGLSARVLARARARLGPEETVRQVLRVACADPAAIPPDLLDASIELVGAREAVPGIDRAFLQAARSLLRAGARARSYRAMMAAIDAPVLLVHGVRDRLIPVRAARDTARRFPAWRYVELPAAGHVPHMEAPAAVEREIWSWIAEAGVG